VDCLFSEIEIKKEAHSMRIPRRRLRGNNNGGALTEFLKSDGWPFIPNRQARRRLIANGVVAVAPLPIWC
jgi:hypothetical protein